METWKPVKGYEGHYEVSDLGRVRSIKHTPRIMKPAPAQGGYLQLILIKDGEKRPAKIHRLVAEAFCVKTKDCTDVNHKNEVKTDNRAENLEWCTKSYNINYGTARERIIRALGKRVGQYTADGEKVAEYPSIKAAARAVGVRPFCIASVLRGQPIIRKDGRVYMPQSAAGFKWRYEQ